VSFEPMAKIPRLHGDCIVTEKIDGTNGCIELAPGSVSACSRNRRLVTISWVNHPDAPMADHPLVEWHGTDNMGFGAWVVANYPSLVRLGYGRHFGEWYGQGIQRTYGLDHKRFALFRPPAGGLPEGLPASLGVVPRLGAFNTFSTAQIEAYYQVLKLDGSQAVPGFMNPEGIVVFHARSGCLFKLTDAAGPKGQKEDA
jgi:hypothetical protein